MPLLCTVESVCDSHGQGMSLQMHMWKSVGVTVFKDSTSEETKVLCGHWMGDNPTELYLPKRRVSG